jgi:hypothetical protein
MQLRRAIIIGLVLGHALGLTLSPGRVRAQADGIMISQLQAGGAGSGHASDEFVELYNASAMPLSLDRWALQYRSGTATGDCTQGWSTKLTLATGVIVAPGTYWLAAATGYGVTADGRFSAGLASTKGTVRLLDTTGQQVDALAWGGSACGMGSSAPAPPDGQSLERLAGMNNGNNLTDFAIQASPQPRSSATVAVAPASYPVLELTEVAMGQSGFIELHNPNDTPVQTSAYGLTLADAVYHIVPGVLEADAYLLIPASLSGLTASGDGGQVRLTDPSGATIDRTDSWPTAIVGDSWALSDDVGWEWTSLPTPGAVNQFPAVPPDDTTTTPTPSAPASPSVELSEILPNPTTVLNGAMEKYVELHNTGTDAVVLDGYVLRSGANLGNHETIAQLTIQPGAYVALPLSVTHLSLAIDGSKVGLFDTAGNLVGETVTYGKAPAGQAYAKFSDGWHWTTLPTPGAANILVAPPAAVAKAKAAKAAKGVKAKKAPAAKKIKVPKTKLAKTTPASFATAAASPNGRWLLFILAGLTMVYISYEFRLDLQHYYYRCRRYLAARRQPGPKADGSDDPGADQ